MGIYHKSALLHTACHFLNIRPGMRFIDATVGGGGHTGEILKNGGLVLGIDQDPEAIAACLGTYGEYVRTGRLVLVKASFTHLSDIAREHIWVPASGVIFDLGVSQHQFAVPQRGFSFQLQGPLDMRMDPDVPNSAADLVNFLPAKALALLFREFGQVNNSRGLAEKIVASRPVETTGKLARIIGPSPQLKRKAFQALRIAVNDELSALSSSLPQAWEILEPEGRLVVISFHSLEDRIVKQQFKDWETSGLGTVLTPRQVAAQEAETLANPYSKSAKLRSISKI